MAAGVARVVTWSGEACGPPVHLPRHVHAGPLLLDLFHRDARAGDRWLHLHPLEFAVLWLLADAAPEPLSQPHLLREAWRVEFDPGSNRVAVVVCRIRAKLRAAGLRGLVATVAGGAYSLNAPEALDSVSRLGDGGASAATG